MASQTIPTSRCVHLDRPDARPIPRGALSELKKQGKHGNVPVVNAIIDKGRANVSRNRELTKLADGLIRGSQVAKTADSSSQPGSVSTSSRSRRPTLI